VTQFSALADEASTVGAGVSVGGSGVGLGGTGVSVGGTGVGLGGTGVSVAGTDVGLGGSGVSVGDATTATSVGFGTGVGPLQTVNPAVTIPKTINQTDPLIAILTFITEPLSLDDIRQR
jgi:hypothetical protein